MTDDPILVEVLRGALVESAHRGAFVVMDADGGILAQAGDVDRPVFPRSAVKALQALPLVESGAADDFTDAELAMACASHSGEPEHAALAAAMLSRVGLAEPDLECGVHWPMSASGAQRLAAGGRRPSQLHNNCSGKHAGFVCFACHEGIDPAGYVAAGHKVQRHVRDALREMTGEELGPDVQGVDGCSIPTFAIPLKSLALAFARLGSGAHLSPERAKAFARIRAACAAAPFYVAGTDRFDTDVMTLLGTSAFVKTGAEGVYCGALPDLGLGIALKADDGAGRAAEVAMAALIAALLPISPEKSAAFARFVTPKLVNWKGTEVGAMRPAGALLAVGSDTGA